MYSTHLKLNDSDLRYTQRNEWLDDKINFTPAEAPFPVRLAYKAKKLSGARPETIEPILYRQEYASESVLDQGKDWSVCVLASEKDRIVSAGGLAAANHQGPDSRQNKGLNQDVAGFYQNGDLEVCFAADGMGGLSSGADYSRLAINALLEEINVRGYIGDVGELRKRIAASFHNFMDASTFSGPHGGTTLAFAQKVGNSRLDLWHNGDAKIIVTTKDEVLYNSKDGSVAQEDADEVLSERFWFRNRDTVYTRTLFGHPHKNSVPSAILNPPGDEEYIHYSRFDIASLKAKGAIYVLACTDGLSDYGSAEDVRRIVSSSANKVMSAGELARAVVRFALQQQSNSGTYGHFQVAVNNRSCLIQKAHHDHIGVSVMAFFA